MDRPTVARANRPTIKQLSLRRRHLGLNAGNRVEAENLENFMQLTASIEEGSSDASSSDDTVDTYIRIRRHLSASRLLYISTLPREILTQPLPSLEPGFFVTLNALPDDYDCRNNFRFTKPELIEIFQGLKFPSEFHCRRTSYKFSGEQVFLAGLYRLVNVNRCGDLGWQTFFGYHQARASIAIGIFFNYMMEHWSYLILDNLDFWAPRLQGLSQAIVTKANRLDAAADLEPTLFRICGFIDNTTIETARPGGGPRVDGHRNNPLIQQSFYNGWKKNHGLKFQTIDLPNGMNMDVYGPVSLRHSDIYTWNHSSIGARLTALFSRHNVPNFRIYGDSAYVVISDDTIAFHVADEATRGLPTTGPRNRKNLISLNYYQ
jgi:hypothetical protein